MSDVSQGPGWWQASDGKWYPPEQAPSAAPAASGLGSPAVAGAATGPGGAPLAEWPQRVIAYLIDVAIIFVFVVVGFIVGLILGAVSSALEFLWDTIFYLAAVAASFYFGFLNGSTGQSPGKRLTGLKVISEETGQVIGGGMGVVRQIAHVVDSLICYIGWLFPLWDAKKQTIADKLMKTVVITGAPKQAFGPDLFK